MHDLFENANIEVEDEEEDRYCIFCDANFVSSEFMEHHVSQFHIDNRIEKLAARNPDADTCGECDYLQVEDDIDFYCKLGFDSVLAAKGYLNCKQEEDGRYVPTQPTSCSNVNIWRMP